MEAFDDALGGVTANNSFELTRYHPTRSAIADDATGPVQLNILRSANMHMRHFMFLILTVMFATGCVGGGSHSQPQTFDGLLNPMTELEVGAMKKRLNTLRVGMTVDRCLDALRFDNRRTYTGDAREAKTRLNLFFGLNEQHTLELLFDTTSGSPRLLSAAIDETIWPPLPSPPSRD